MAQYRYDSLNRISQIAYDDDTVGYTWDTCTNGIGRLCSVSTNASTVSYRYDPHGRITKKTQTAGAAPLAVSHSYNNVGQRTQTVTPGGQTIDYQWSGGQLTALSVNGQPVLSQITYEPDGQINGWVWGNSQPSERFYDLTGRPVIVSFGVDAKTQQPDSRTYGYDAAGRLTGVLGDSNPQLNQQHAYDELDRLSSSERGEPVQSRTDYSYDLSGNRTETIQDNTIVTNGTIDPSSNRLQSQSGAQTVNYNYDSAGNLTADGTDSYTYNAAGRRISATAVNLNARYTYNALDQRVTKTVNGITSQYVYDEQGHLTGEYDSAGQLLQEIVWLGDLPVAVLKPATNQAVTTDLYYIHADHLGTPRAITRPTDNKVMWTWESEAFGNSLPDPNPSGLGTFVFNLRFPGQYYDAETGGVYNGFRDYDPSTGRYGESDPIGLAGGMNTYAYVGNSPVNWIDPFGLVELSPGQNPLIGGGVTGMGSGGSSLGGAGAFAVMGSAIWAVQNAPHIEDAAGPYSPWSPDSEVNKQFVRDRDNVKEKDVKPPPYENPNKPKCDEIRDRIKRIKESMQARDYLTNKWYGGVWDAGHKMRQKILEDQLKKLNARLEREDCKCP